MPTLTYPYSFVNGTTADANQVDANFNAASTVVNGLDFANVGANGFYASQIIPTSTFQAQFGGALGYKFAPGVAGQVPLTLAGISGQTADLFDVFVATTKVAYIDNAGNFFTTGTVNATGAVNTGPLTVTGNMTASGYVAVGPSVGAVVAGDGSFARSASTGQIDLGGATSRGTIDYGLSFTGWLTLSAQTDIQGPLQCAKGGQSVQAFVAPVYTGSGVATANTLHIVTQNVVAAGTSTTVTLTNAAIFSAVPIWLVQDLNTPNNIITLTGSTASSCTFASTSGHTYSVFAIGI